MKKIILLAIAIIIGTFSANAQIGGLLDKAKKLKEKTENKIIDQTSEKAADKVSDAIVDQIGIPEQEVGEEPTAIDSDEPLTYEGLMRMLPVIPSVQQMVSYKKAELNGQGFKQLSSELMKFQMTVLDLTGKVYSIPYQGADSTEIVEAAYRNAELYTGLTKEEIEMLATMSEEEQDTYLKEHYTEGQAEAVLLQQAAEIGEEMEPLQPIIDRWSSYDEKIAQINNESNLDEQLPVAMELDEQMIPIRERHPNAISATLNYPQPTASQYFTETLRILEVPEYKKDTE